MLLFFNNHRFIGLHVVSQGCNRECGEKRLESSACKIYLNGNTDNLCVAPRGHNLVVIDPETVRTVSKGFDTYNSTYNVIKLKYEVRLKALRVDVSASVN